MCTAISLHRNKEKFVRAPLVNKSHNYKSVLCIPFPTCGLTDTPVLPSLQSIIVRVTDGGWF